jgi:hypothetical protein
VSTAHLPTCSDAPVRRLAGGCCSQTLNSSFLFIPSGTDHFLCHLSICNNHHCTSRKARTMGSTILKEFFYSSRSRSARHTRIHLGEVRAFQDLRLGRDVKPVSGGRARTGHAVLPRDRQARDPPTRLRIWPSARERSGVRAATSRRSLSRYALCTSSVVRHTRRATWLPCASSISTAASASSRCASSGAA